MHLRNRIRLKKRVLLAFLLLSNFTLAQNGFMGQDFIQNNLGMYNPAHIGALNKLSVNGFAKAGRIGTKYQNIFGGLGLEYSFDEKHNIGFSLKSRREADWLNQDIYLGYSYRQHLDKKPISFGYGINIGYKGLNHLNYLQSPHPLDSALLVHNTKNKSGLYLSFGIDFWLKEKFFFGFYGDNLLAYNNFTSENELYRDERQFHNRIGLGFTIGSKRVNLPDSITDKSYFESVINVLVGLPQNLQRESLIAKIDIVFGLNIKNLITPRIGFRISQPYSEIIFGLQSRIYKGLFLGYSYNLALKQVEVIGKGSHEINLGFFLPNKLNLNRK